MSRRAAKHVSSTYPLGHQHAAHNYIVPTANDVLFGRGVNIADHPGNKRLRALVRARQDEDYCASYTSSEKRAVALEIIGHIRSLSPPGRFLKRPGRSKSSRGLEGPWEVVSEGDAIRKVTQALRDGNRQDRTSYAADVNAPEDVVQQEQLRLQAGLTNKQLAERAAEEEKKRAQEVAEQLGKRSRLAYATGNVSPSIEDAALCLSKKPRGDVTTPMHHTSTPATAATSGGSLHDSIFETHYHGSPIDSGGNGSSMPPSPAVAPASLYGTLDPAVPYSFDHQQRHSTATDLEPLHDFAEAALSGHHSLQLSDNDVDDDCPPPSPLHPEHHPGADLQF